MSQQSDAEFDWVVTPVAILETVLYCDDLIAARRFYEGVLGLSLVSHEPGRHLFFRVGSSMLLLFNAQQTRQDTVRVADQVIPRHGADGASHMAFQAEPSQIDRMKANLIEQGVAIETEIDWPGGGHSIYCRDPAGNSIEFATRSLWFEENTVES